MPSQQRNKCNRSSKQKTCNRLAGSFWNVTGQAREQVSGLAGSRIMECNKLKGEVRAVACLASSVTDVTGLASRLICNGPAGSRIMECNKLGGKVRTVTCLASSVIDVTGLAKDQSESCIMLKKHAKQM